MDTNKAKHIREGRDCAGRRLNDVNEKKNRRNYTMPKHWHCRADQQIVLQVQEGHRTGARYSPRPRLVVKKYKHHF